MELDVAGGLGQRLQALDGLIGQLAAITDPRPRTVAQEAVGLLMDLHEASLTRMLELAGAYSPPGDALLAAWAKDELVGQVLLLYGLHPVPVAARVEEALASVEPYLKSHGGSVSLADVSDGVVRLRLSGRCKSCPSSTLTVKNAIETAIFAKAPDVVQVIVESSTPREGAPNPAPGCP